MKRINLIIPGLLLLLTVFTACDDFLSPESDRLIAGDEYRLVSPGDTIFSTLGLFTQLQKLADSYVLLGELRADLLDVTDESDESLREINNFEVSATNSYVNIRNYYAVINNCNYILAHLDTNRVDKGQRLQLAQYAAVKSIRAWTYMQLALNFKKVKYYEHPILTIADAEKPFEELEFEALAARLIPQLEQVQGVEARVTGFAYSYASQLLFFPVKFVLGDLYLWTGAYEQAATAYRGLMYDRRIIINKANYSYWIPVNNTISANAYLYWNRSFLLNSGEVVTAIVTPEDYGISSYLDTLNNQHRFKPSSIALNNWKKQVYYLNEASNNQGDLRMYGSVSYDEVTNADATTDYTFSGMKTNKPLIYKYKMYDESIIVYRSSLLYLRYAEAVNRLHKPNLAMAVLKNGLSSVTIFDEKVVPARERSTPLPVYMQFSDIRFQNNAGIRMRGLGNAQNDTTFYRIPKLAGIIDSVRFVEDKIQEEIALETAFEGNRFHDLMRITLRRMNDTGYGDTEAYLADKIAGKHTDFAGMKSKLMNRENWFIGNR